MLVTVESLHNNGDINIFVSQYFGLVIIREQYFRYPKIFNEIFRYP